MLSDIVFSRFLPEHSLATPFLKPQLSELGCEQLLLSSSQTPKREEVVVRAER